MIQKDINELLSLGDLYIVGSVRHKESPRDIDIILVLRNRDFRRYFGLTARRWCKEIQSGNWSAPLHYWSAICIIVSRELEKRMGLDDHFLDFKIYPKRYFKKGE